MAVLESPKRGRAGIWLVLCAMLSGFVANAQSQGAPDDTREETVPEDDAESPAATSGARARIIEEVMVTAQKREQSLRDVPIAISAFSGDRLSELDVVDTRDLQRLVPGFNANESGRGSTLFTLRGVGFTDTTYTATSTVGTYVDEINIPYSVMTRGANIDIQRVEVLKGPQGILYGRNTTGGLINYVSNKPTTEFEAGSTVTYQRFDHYETDNYISGPILDSLLGRFAFKYVRSYEGWQISRTRPDDTLGEVDKLSGRLSLEWSPLDSLRVDFRFEGWHDHSDPHAPQVVGIIPGNPFLGEEGLPEEIRNYPFFTDDADPREADWPVKGETFPGHLDDDFFLVAIKSIWNITDSMEFTTILSHLEQESDDSPQLQGFHITETDLITNATIYTDALEMRLSDRWWNERFYWSLGINLSKDDAYEEQFADTTNAGALFSGFRPPGEERNPISDKVIIIGEPEIEQRAVFLNTDTDITDSLTLNLGARYTENDQTFWSCTLEPENAEGEIGLSETFTLLSFQTAAEYQNETGQPGDPQIIEPGECFSLGEDGNNRPFTDELNESNVSGRAALSWRVGDNLYFASVSRGYKAGGFPVLNAGRKAQLKPVTQEELLAYELGTKLSFFDGVFRPNLTGFYYDYTDKQLLTKILDETFGPLPILQNAPRSHVYGIELDFDFRPIDGLLLAFAGSYVKTEIDEFVGRNSEGEPQDFTDMPFNYSPERQFSFLAQYVRPVFDMFEVGVAADYYYTGETNGAIDQNPLLDMDAYDSIGARAFLGAIDKKWKVTVFGRNLENELKNLGTNSWSEAVTRHVDRPRTFGITINYRWR